MRFVAALAAHVALSTALFAGDRSEWMQDDGGRLQLMLAHEERGGPDGGVLTIDRGRQSLLWEGAPGAVGCKLGFESSFSNVKAVHDKGDGAGFVLELREGKTRKLTFLPLPHAQWFAAQFKVAEGKFGQTIPEGTLRVAGGRRGESSTTLRPYGSAADAAPSLKRRQIPKAVIDDTRAAIDGILEAMGRERRE